MTQAGTLPLAGAFQGASRRLVEIVYMTEDSTRQNDRRKSPRLSVSVPLVIFIEDHGVSTYARDVSGKGVYFYLGTSDSEIINHDFEFVLQFPPEVTLSLWCSIRGRGRIVRKDFISKDLTGVAAEILQYSIDRTTATNI